jgi:tetratricopeptide (TPR) repeat protein
METTSALATLLRKYMDRAGVLGDQRLVRMVNDNFGSSFLSRSTVAHWLRGEARRVRDWRQLLAVGKVLRLDEAEVDQLLSTSQHPSLRVLWQQASPEHFHFFETWRGQPDQWHPEDMVVDKEVRRLTALPKGSRVLARANPLFQGRLAEFKFVVAALRNHRAVVVHGTAGVGKTQFALEFAHRYGQYFPGGVFWLTCADPQMMDGEVAGCGGFEGMELRPTYNSLPLHQQVQLVRQAWEEPTPRLLIFDACENDDILRDWWPRSGGCHVLVTSRRGYWNPTLGLTALSLEPLPEQDAIHLLHKYRSSLATTETEALAKSVGTLPLALHLMGSYLARHLDVSADTYLNELKTQHILNHSSLTGVAAEYSPTKYEPPGVAQTFKRAYIQLDTSHPVDTIARQLLARLSHFAPETSVPLWLLLATHPGASKQHIERLVEAGFVSLGEETVRLHQLLRVFLHLQHTDPTALEAVETTLFTIASTCHDSADSPSVRTWQAHLIYVTHHARPRQDLMAAQLCRTLGNYWRDQGQYENAKAILEESVRLHEQLLGKEHIATADAISAYALLLEDMGYLAESRPLQERALSIREIHYGAVHQEVAKSLNDLGWLLQNTGDFVTARRYFERALEIKREVLPPVHFSLSLAINNLASLLYAMKEYETARGYYEESLHLAEQLYAPEHLALSTVLLNLGATYAALENYSLAEGYLKRALTIRETQLGRDHPRTAHVLHNLGRILLDRGRLNPSKRYLERALAIRRAELSPNHYQIGMSLYHLGRWHEKSGNLREAKTLYREALPLVSGGKGETHPDTLEVLNSLESIQRRTE